MIKIKRNVFRILFCMVVLFLALIIKSSVFAVTEDVTSTIPEEFKSFIVNTEYYNNPDYDFISYKCNDTHNCVFFKKTDTLKFYAVESSWLGSYVRWIVTSELWDGHYYSLDESFNVIADNVVYSADWTHTGAGGCQNNIDSYYYNSVDLYTDNTYSTIFFPRTPLIQEKVLAPIVEEKKETMGMVLQEIVVILPMILVVVVSLVGLRKALSMLFSLLRQS